MHSAIYQGQVRHRRFVPRAHAFTYSSTLFYLDLEELPALFDGTFGWSCNQRNLGWFRRADYLGPTTLPLIDAVRTEVRRQRGSCPDGPVRLLTNLRLWGTCFNPVSLYYCFEQGAEFPSVVLAQVNNTPWLERHCYALPCDPANGKVRTGFVKQFHVSPFNPMDMHYQWMSTAPGETLAVHMENHKDDQCHMDATLTLTRRPWSAAALRRILWLHPWQSLKIPVAIYWEALRLIVKRVPIYDHTPVAPVQSKNTELLPVSDRSKM
ncbi:DUF1365 domain-containing protein [Marinimicrobium alkaliphilum]|uniref:DUF1365 domain-containing protein n=1 Tax=Marinimicrobium alkaliphilum TaxID=2202654 RepID=UPI000DB9B212|nr:DUF1365 domain-containing protein [Marinimicrobium alkaliphilum]